jgi:hypothetical protein
MNIRLMIAALVTLSVSVPALAQSDHDHDHGHDHESVDFANVDDGWAALEDVAAEIRATIKAKNLTPLHDLSDRLHSVADGLARHASDVAKPNQLRFTSSLNQLRTMSDRLHAVHEDNDVAAAERLVPQLNGVVQLLMVSAEGK